MFANVDEAISWITSRTRSAHQASDFRQYVQSLGNPQLKLKCLHVAGTNGKGSTTNYLRSILQKAGYKVGSFTSPHLMTHLDRIRINDENISADYFLKIINEKQQEWESHDLTMFEIDTLISIYYFLDQQVDYAVYEVGLGGRLDPTNIIMPIGAVITNIEMDHMNILGNTIRQIAREKAGIIKDGLTFATFEKKRAAIEVFNMAAKVHKAKMIRTHQARNVKISDHIEFDYQSYHVSLPTIAPYQILNASAAIALLRALKREKKLQISKADILQGLQTSWAVRFEQVSEKPRVIIDGAHNENGIDELCHALAQIPEEKVIVFSALKDKRYRQMLEKLQGQGELIITEFASKRSTTAENLAEGLEGVTVIDDWNEAIDEALRRNKTVIITGSLYFISLVRERFLKQ